MTNLELACIKNSEAIIKLSEALITLNNDVRVITKVTLNNDVRVVTKDLSDLKKELNQLKEQFDAIAHHLEEK